jgi:two-component system alkaline phosphatase synthesis response regulator PhoP
MKKKILLIDDDEDLLRSFQVILEGNGYDVITSTDSSNCFSILKNDKPDLLVLDVMMNTDLEGFNLLKVIKRDPVYRKMPIILLTGIREQIGFNLLSVIEDESLFPYVRYQDKPVTSHFLMEMIIDMLKG